MQRHLRIGLQLVVLVASTAIARGEQAPDRRVADLVQSGRVRVALFPPQYTKDPATGAIRADTHLIETARAFAAHLGVELQLVEYSTPAKAMEGLRDGSCDLAFLGILASRADEVGFSPALVELDYTYLVPQGSAIRNVADADRPGVRIAAVRSHASTLALTRMLKHAKLVYAETPDSAFELLRTGRANAWASVAYALHAYSVRLPDSRVLEDRYGANLLAVAVAKGKAERLAYISEFIEEAKASGLVQRAIGRGGLRGVRVAPPVRGPR